jgi:GDPmannose 4,6-dehydratase
VSQKIAYAAANLALGRPTSDLMDERGEPILKDGKLRLGSTDIFRDFGFAGDYVKAMHAIVSSDEASDYVIGTGEMHSIAEFCEIAFHVVGLQWTDHVIADERLVRKGDHSSCADPGKLFGLLGRSFKTSFLELVTSMVEAQLAALRTKLRSGQ